MTGSYEKINYGLRPAKSIERKMLCEVFRRLAPFGKLESYRYIGFGSTYFSDFILFHKSLGLNRMISIEKDEDNEDRFSFNLPFRCIDLKFGSSNDVLSTLPWDVKSIVWLDYDGALTTSELADIKFLVMNAVPGSLVMISVNALPSGVVGVKMEKYAEHRLNNLISKVGEDKIPTDINGTHLAQWGTAKVSRRIIRNEIDTTLNDINGVRDPGTHLKYKQLFNFHYSDGAKMLTTGGILYDEGQQDIVNQCAFDDLHYISTDETPYLIEVPNLTYREIRHLDKQLPRIDSDTLKADFVPENDMKKYEKIYRYFPNFAETEN